MPQSSRSGQRNVSGLNFVLVVYSCESFCFGGYKIREMKCLCVKEVETERKRVCVKERERERGKE